MEDATVADIAEMMLDLMAAGKGDYIVGYQEMYILTNKGMEPTVNDENQTVDF